MFLSFQGATLGKICCFTSVKNSDGKRDKSGVNMFWHNAWFLLLNCTFFCPVINLLRFCQFLSFCVKKKMQLVLVGLRLRFSQHSFQEFCFLWSCSSRAGDWEGTVPLARLTASGMPSQGSFVFRGCSGLGCFSMLEQRWLKGQRKEKERNEDPGKADA